MASPRPSPAPLHLTGATLVLVRTQGPVNLGMIARLCGNLGITDLRLVSPLCGVDVEDARKFAVHAKDFLLAAPVFSDLAAAVADCGLVIGTSARIRETEAGVPMLPEDIPALLTARTPARWAVVFGNEADGLTEAELECCQAYVRLHSFGDIFSYNLSHAVAIIMYLIASQGVPRTDAPVEAVATRGEIERLFTYWQHTLERFNFFRRTSADHFAPRLRRLLNHLPLTSHDIRMLWGMLGQFHYRTFGDRSGPDYDAGTAELTKTDDPPV